MARISTGANSLALRLLVLLLVPLLAIGILATQRIQNDRNEARNARMLVDEARFDQAVEAVYAPAQFERTGLKGLAAIDAFGLPRDMVVPLFGDGVALDDSNAIPLGTATSALIARHGHVRLAGGSTLAERLDPVLIRLAEQQNLSDERRATVPELREVFDDFDEILSDAVNATEFDGSAATLPRQAELDAVSVVLRAASERGTALLEALVGFDDDSRQTVIEASARLDLAVEQLKLALRDPDRIRALDDIVDGIAPLPASLTAPPSAGAAGGFDPAGLTAAAGAVIDQLEVLRAFERYSAELHDDIVAELEARAVAAEQATVETRNLVLVAVLVSLLLLLAVAWATLRPLERLTRRATSIAHGEFDVAPLPLKGPSDVRTLTTTVNEMADTLSAVDREIARLADGRSDNGDVRLPGAIGTSIDRSFRRLNVMTDRLRASEALASAIVSQAADAIWTIDGAGLIVSANEASAALLGIDSADQVGTSLRSHFRRLDGETRVRHVSGTWSQVVVSSSDIGDAGITAVMAHDVSERRRFEERLAHQAHHDELTGLPNRTAVLAALDDIDPDRALAVLFVDLDGFKSVNDMQGHLAGDEVLTEVGERLARKVRHHDIVARLGGDHFAIVMTDLVSDTEAIDFSTRIVSLLEQPFQHGSSLFALSASVGVATFPDGLGAERLSPLDAIRRADGAVHAAKARGRGHVELYDSELDGRLVHDAEMELSLRKGIIDGELTLHLQPVLDLTTSAFTSAEALVRWNRPGVGLVPPGEFIPIAEKSSLIEDIGRWVLMRACETVAGWRVDDPSTSNRIAVNIAGSHLLNGDLVADVDAAVRATGADPHLLEIELTESQLMNDYARATSVLRQLRERGVKIAIDDFGTGYSSMAYLRELPIDTLKIDRSFVAPLEHEGSDTTVIDALVTIGHALGLSIVAEGIETEQQLAHLATMGCDRAQGFLMARPQPIETASPLLGSHFDGALALH